MQYLKKRLQGASGASAEHGRCAECTHGICACTHVPARPSWCRHHDGGKLKRMNPCSSQLRGRGPGRGPVFSRTGLGRLGLGKRSETEQRAAGPSSGVAWPSISLRAPQSPADGRTTVVSSARAKPAERELRELAPNKNSKDCTKPISAHPSLS